MSESYRSAGIKNTASFSADPDPNTTPPAGDRILQLEDRTVTGALAKGFKAYPVFTNPASTPELTLTVWSEDFATGAWVKGLEISGIGDYAGFQVEKMAPARITFQITSLGGGTADDVEIFVAPTA